MDYTVIFEQPTVIPQELEAGFDTTRIEGVANEHGLVYLDSVRMILIDNKKKRVLPMPISIAHAFRISNILARMLRLNFPEAIKKEHE